jgi:RNA polymerase sigma factor (sigma-70 family)
VNGSAACKDMGRLKLDLLSGPLQELMLHRAQPVLARPVRCHAVLERRAENHVASTYAALNCSEPTESRQVDPLPPTADGSDSSDGSVTVHLGHAKLGESFAQFQLWQRYVERLVRLAKASMSAAQNTVAEPEDIALEAFNDLLVGLEQNRFRQLNDRNDLWRVLIMLIKRRSIDELRKANSKKRNGRQATDPQHPPLDRQVTYLGCQDRISCEEPTPDEAMLLKEELSLRINELEDATLQSIALAKMAGHDNREIADRMNVSLRSVERKLSIIRRRWLEGR